MFLRISQYSQEAQALETRTQVFSCEICKLFMKTFFTEHLLWLPLLPRLCKVRVTSFMKNFKFDICNKCILIYHFWCNLFQINWRHSVLIHKAKILSKSAITPLRHYPFSRCVKFSEKLKFFTPWYNYMCVSGSKKNLLFGKFCVRAEWMILKVKPI